MNQLTCDVLQDGFKSVEKGQPIRFGMYFLEKQIQPGKSKTNSLLRYDLVAFTEDALCPIGPTMKLVLCKMCVGNSICRSEVDVENLSRCPPGYESVYVPEKQSSGTAVFNDTYLMYDTELAIPTHVVSYHFDVAQVSFFRVSHYSINTDTQFFSAIFAG